MSQSVGTDSSDGWWCHICQAQVPVNFTSSEPVCLRCGSSGFVEYGYSGDTHRYPLGHVSTTTHSEVTRTAAPAPHAPGAPSPADNNSPAQLSEVIRSIVQNVFTQGQLPMARGTEGPLVFGSGHHTGSNPFVSFDSEFGTGGGASGPLWSLQTTTDGFPGSDFESFLGGFNHAFSHAFNILSDQGFQNVLQFIMDNDPNRHGSPPTSERVLQSMNPRVLTAETAVGDCAVCQEFFKEGEKVYALKDAAPIDDEHEACTCTHVFHEDCLMPWLRQHNSCPVCRFELPTDDEDYERRKADVSRRLRAAVRRASDNPHPEE